jgi:regulator of protease activity HflC (stomatin/prohibitin superfamily)
MSLIFLIPIAVILISGLRLIYQYEQGVVFTLGKYQGTKQPGLRWVIPGIQTMQKVDIRVKTVDVPKQEMLTKDNITVYVNAVVYFKVLNPERAIIEIQDYLYAVSQYTQAALRDVIGNNELDSVLTERQKIAGSIKELVDTETDKWGIDIDSIKIQEIELPENMKRAIAKQAEAERGRRAIIISSDGELKASENLQLAAEKLSQNPAAIHLRTLQTIKDISSDPSQKIIMMLPNDFGNIVKKLI